MDITKLKGVIPDSVISEIPLVMEKFQINTPLRLSHFLSQCAHESGGFKVVKENLNYSTEGLLKVFPKYFNAETAKAYARNPEKIANKVYGSRMGNGNEVTGDGWKYCGKGYIQLTGKLNYAAFDAMVPEDLSSNPTLVATKYPLLSAGWFFSKNGINWVADKGSSDINVKEVSRKVNGGTIGLDDRIKWFRKIYPILSA